MPLDGSQWPILAANPVSTPSASTRQPVDVPKWTTVVRRSPKQAKPIIQPVAVQPSTTTRNRNTKGVTGSWQGSGLRSVRRKRLASDFATRFEPQVTCDDILIYLNYRLSAKLSVKVASRLNITLTPPFTLRVIVMTRQSVWTRPSGQRTFSCVGGVHLDDLFCSSWVIHLPFLHLPRPLVELQSV